MYSWSVKDGYNVTSKGDKRFSAFYAKLEDGRSIEQWYQCDVKGYDIGGINWRIGKGKPSLIQYESLFLEYVNLWKRYLFKDNNFTLLQELATYILPFNNYTLCDPFATSDINQAHAIAHILNEIYYNFDKSYLFNDEYKLLIAGGRNFNNYRLLEKEAYSICLDLSKTFSKITIVQGEAIGADSLAIKFAAKYNIPCEGYKPDYNSKYGRAAPFKRNEKMGDISHGLLAFWDGESKGTKHMIEYMHKLKKPVKIIKYKINTESLNIVPIGDIFNV